MEQIRFTQETVQRVSRLPEAEQLLEVLRADGGAALDRAAAQLKNGSLQQALAQLQPMLNTPQTKALLRQLSEKLG